MSNPVSWVRQRALALALSVAATLATLQLIMPPLIDTIFDFIMVGVVAVVGWLARSEFPNDPNFK